MTLATLDDIRSCVKKTIDDCLAEVLMDRPAAYISDRQNLQLVEVVEELSQLFLDIRLQNR